MIHDGRILGLPLVDYSGTKVSIEALPAEAGMTAFATDANQWGYRDNAMWQWFDEPDSYLQATDIDTLAELNAIITDATLDDSGNPRNPTDHGHTAPGDGGTLAHAVLTGIGANDHHSAFTPTDFVASGDRLFTVDDGLLLLGPGCPCAPGAWQTLRAQTATLVGAFNQVTGPWAETRALRFEPAATNLVPNPSFEVNVTDGWSIVNSGGSTGTATRVAGGVRGNYCCKFETTNFVRPFPRYMSSVLEAGLTGYTYTVTARVKSDIAGYMVLYVGGYSVATASIPTSRNWEKITLSRTLTSDGDVQVYFRSTRDLGKIWIDAVQVTRTAYASSYLDGDQGHGYSWSGTPHNSTSTRAANYADLDTLCGMLSDLNTVSHSIWIQAQYDADEANWPCSVNQAFILDYRGADSDNRTYLRFEPNTDDQFSAYLNGANRITATNQTFVAGDWLHLVLTLDYASNSYKLYLNGALIGSSTAALTAPTALVNWKLAVPYTANTAYMGGWSYGEYAVWNRVLDEEEVAAIYASGVPLMDAGAFTPPVANHGPLAAMWFITSDPQNHTGNTDYTEAGSNQETRFGWGTWVSGKLQFETILKISDAAATGYAKLQWDNSGTWRDVKGSEVSLTGIANADLVRSPIFTLSPDEREYRVVIKTSDGAETVTLYKAALICTPGGLEVSRSLARPL